MRNLDFTSDSPQSIKLGDSNDALSLKATELGQPVDLSKASSIIVKIGNTAGYLTEINVDVASLLHPTDGIIDVVISSKVSSTLPAGDYLLEVWIDDAQGNTVIYPDSSYPTVIGFSIKKNIMTATSTAITTLTLADFEAKFDEMQEDLQHKAASGYFKGDTGPQGEPGQTGPQGVKGDKGDKGDTGSVDNAGLTTAPAFVALQTQVNNSAVGTNLFSQSTATAGYIDYTTGNVNPASSSNELASDYIAVSASSNYTLQMWGTTPSEKCYWSGIGEYDANKNFIVRDTVNGITQTSDTAEYVSKTLTTTSTTAFVRVSFSKFNDYKVKFEKGSNASDWSPNPTDILTQADYAKIKAAIVALGGSLS